jgi:stringent starvation protein B
MATLPSKKDVLLKLLESTSVLISLDARSDGVIVPRHLKTNPQLVLQIGLNLAVPIRDLDVGEDDVRCTLSFSRTQFFCVLPYAAMFAMVSDDGARAMVWPEDVPAEVAQAEERRLRSVESPSPGPAQGASSRLEAATAPKRRRDEPKAPVRPAPKPTAVETDDDPPKEPAATKRELPPYLRVIK